jgi:hypothetical protein
MGRFPDLSQGGLATGSIGGVDQHRDTKSLGHELMEDRQSLGSDLLGKIITGRRYAAAVGQRHDLLARAICAAATSSWRGRSKPRCR